MPDRSLTVIGVGAAEGVEVDRARRRSRSMVMLATSRVNRTRLPLAEMSIFSSMLAPLNSSVSCAGLALDDVAAVAGVPDEGVVAGAHQGRVVAACRR